MREMKTGENEEMFVMFIVPVMIISSSLFPKVQKTKYVKDK